MLNNYTIPPKTYFEIASLGYLLVLYLISFNDPNRKRLRSYKLFRNLEVNMLLALVVSILTYIFAYPELGTPLFICTILRTMDSIMCVMAARLFAIYLMEYVDEINLAHGAEGTRLYSTANTGLKKTCMQNKLQLLDASVRHLGTDINYIVLENMYRELSGKMDFHFLTPVKYLKVEEDQLLVEHRPI